MLAFLKKIAGRIRTEMVVLYLASRHPRLKRPLKIYLLLIIIYFLSPIDLIPDFIPVIGYLDDAILLPLLIFIAFKLIPADISAECRQQAEKQSIKLQKKAAYGLLILALWLLALLTIAGVIIYVW